MVWGRVARPGVHAGPGAVPGDVGAGGLCRGARPGSAGGPRGAGVHRALALLCPGMGGTGAARRRAARMAAQRTPRVPRGRAGDAQGRSARPAPQAQHVAAGVVCVEARAVCKWII